MPDHERCCMTDGHDVEVDGGPGFTIRVETDEEIIARFIGGEVDAIERVRGWVRSQLRGNIGAGLPQLEDIEQDVLLGLLEALEDGRFRGESRFETYVRSFCRFKFIDAVRSKKVRNTLGLEGREFEDQSLSIIERISREQDADLALRVFRALSNDCQLVIKMVVQGATYDEMARRLGMGAGAVRVRVYRCRKRALALKRELLSGVIDHDKGF